MFGQLIRSILGLAFWLGVLWIALQCAGCYDEQCTEIIHNLCVDESIHEMDDEKQWLEMFQATLQCAGVEELKELVIVRIVTSQDTFRCVRNADSVYGCYFNSMGDHTMEVSSTGYAFPHELGHALEDIYGINSPDDKDPEFAHRPCGLAANCGNAIATAFFTQGMTLEDYSNWMDVRPFQCDWRTE